MNLLVAVMAVQKIQAMCTLCKVHFCTLLLVLAFFFLQSLIAIVIAIQVCYKR